MIDIESGTCGTCRWGYRQVDNSGYAHGYVLEVAPIDPERGGVLGAWKDCDPGMYSVVPPWHNSSKAECTVKIKICPGVRATTCTRMFSDFEMVREVDLSGLDTNGVTDMSDMFAHCWSLRSLDVSMLNTSQVINTDHMFFNCRSLRSLDVSTFDTSRVTSANSMFRDCKDLISLDVSKWNVSKVTDMGLMFMNCSFLTSLDVSKWNVSNIRNMSYMFSGCTILTSLDVRTWNTSNVTDMSDMFKGCESLILLDVSNWDISNIKDKAADIQYMFDGCSALASSGALNKIREAFMEERRQPVSLRGEGAKCTSVSEQMHKDKSCCNGCKSLERDV